MPDHLTTNHISALLLIIKKAWEFHKGHHLFIAFIILKAVFDSVEHIALWNILKTIGMPDKLVNLLPKLYDRAECCFRYNRKDSAFYSVNSWVRQEYVVAHDLFNCVINHLMICICQQMTRVWLGSYYLTDLEYAVNTTMFSNTVIDREAGLIVFQEDAWKLDHHLSWEKTKLMHVGYGPEPPPITPVTIVVESVSLFYYLGSTIMNTGDLNK